MLGFYLQNKETEWAHVARRVSQLMPLNEQEEIEQAITDGLFYPGTPILRNASSKLNMASCHSWVVGDSIEEIMDAVKVAALVFKSGGGGIGFDMSELSPSVALLKYIIRDVDTKEYGRASGPVGFWPLFMITSLVIGKARSGKPSGTMGVLNWSHYDAYDWVHSKDEDGVFSESNLTVAVDDWSALVWQDKQFIAHHIWSNGTPGVAFLDNINDDNPTLKSHGRMTTLNVCSEVPGYHATVCFLSSLALPRVITKLGDWTELRRVMRLQVRLLDRVVDVNRFPDIAFRQQSQMLRRIGAGWMGWEDLLRREGIEFGSVRCNDLAHEIGRELFLAADVASRELAEEFGGYMPGRTRNVATIALAPNGHIAPFAGLSPSICLNFNDPTSYTESLLLSPADHIRHLATWAEYVDGGISYTVPLRSDCSFGEVMDALDLAHSLGIKAISMYRDGSRAGQPCSIDGTCDL